MLLALQGSGDYAKYHPGGVISQGYSHVATAQDPSTTWDPTVLNSSQSWAAVSSGISEDTCTDDSGFEDGDGSSSRGSSSSAQGSSMSRLSGWCDNPCMAGSRMSLFSEIAACGGGGSSMVLDGRGGSGSASLLQPRQQMQQLELPAPAGLLLMLDPKRPTSRAWNKAGNDGGRHAPALVLDLNPVQGSRPDLDHGFDSDLRQVQGRLAQLLLLPPSRVQSGDASNRDSGISKGSREVEDAQAVRVLALALQGLHSAYELTRSGNVW